MQADCLGKGHPDVATSLSNLAALATRRGDLPQVRPYIGPYLAPI